MSTCERKKHRLFFIGESLNTKHLVEELLTSKRFPLVSGSRPTFNGAETCFQTGIAGTFAMQAMWSVQPSSQFAMNIAREEKLFYIGVVHSEKLSKNVDNRILVIPGYCLFIG